MHIFFFRRNAITQYNVNFYMYWETNICVIHFPAMFALLWWSGAKHTVSLRHACTSISRDVLFLSTCHSLLLPKVSYTLGGPGGDSSQIWNRESEITPPCDRWVCWGLEKLGDLSKVRSPPSSHNCSRTPLPWPVQLRQSPHTPHRQWQGCCPFSNCCSHCSFQEILPPSHLCLFIFLLRKS